MFSGPVWVGRAAQLKKYLDSTAMAR